MPRPQMAKPTRDQEPQANPTEKLLGVTLPQTRNPDYVQTFSAHDQPTMSCGWLPFFLLAPKVRLPLASQCEARGSLGRDCFESGNCAWARAVPKKSKRAPLRQARGKLCRCRRRSDKNGQRWSGLEEILATEIGFELKRKVELWLKRVHEDDLRRSDLALLGLALFGWTHHFPFPLTR